MNTNFSNWVKWEDRNNLDGMSFPGIYCIAISESDLTGQSFKWINEIKYIGMSNSQGGLKSRLRQFDNTIKGKKGHGGADRFRYKHEEYSVLIKNLFVSVQVFECDVKSNKPENLIIMGDVLKHEFVCFAEFVNVFGKLPEFNDKPNSPKYSLTKGRKKQ
jgi:hypothetical protein